MGMEFFIAIGVFPVELSACRVSMFCTANNVDFCKRYKAFTFFHGALSDTLKKSRGKNLIIVPL